MVALAWVFLSNLPRVRTGVVLIGVARCIAMVNVWNEAADGDTELCTIIVVVNSLLQIILFTPVA